MLQESLALCGHMIKPPALKIRSTGADEAGTHKAWFAILKRAGYSSNFSYQKLKIFQGNTVIVKTSCKDFLNCTLGVGFVIFVLIKIAKNVRFRDRGQVITRPRPRPPAKGRD